MNEWIRDSLTGFSIWSYGTRSFRAPLVKLRKCFSLGLRAWGVNAQMQAWFLFPVQTRRGYLPGEGTRSLAEYGGMLPGKLFKESQINGRERKSACRKPS